MLRGDADAKELALAAHDFAILAHFFHRSSYFHVIYGK